MTDPNTCIPHSFNCHEVKKCGGYFNVAIRYYCSTTSGENDDAYINPRWWTFIEYNGVILLALVFAVAGLSLIVSNYMFPNLRRITSRLKINDKFLGFIIIPFINSFPDILNYYNSIKANSIELALGQLIGSNLILLSLILGLISLLKPTSIKSHKFLLLDVLWVFVILAVFNIILKDGKITLTESLVMAVIYIFHLVYLFGINKNLEVDLINLDSQDSDNLTFGFGLGAGAEPATGIEAESPTETGTETINKYSSHDNDNNNNNQDFDISAIHESEPINIDHQLELIQQHQMDHQPHVILSTAHWILHCLDILLKVLLPDENVGNKWKQIYYYGVSCVLLWQKFPFISLGIILSLSIPLLALITHRTTVPHLINVVGIINSIIIMADVSIFILKLLKNCGLILQISDYLLGFLVFSVANSINDLITNITLSVKVHSLLGINASLGTPLVLILVGIGYNTLVLNKTLKFSLQFDLFITSLALMTLMGVLLIIIPINNWKLNKKIGVSLLVFWLSISLTNCILERSS